MIFELVNLFLHSVVMKAMGADPTPDQLERLVQMMDADRSGYHNSNL